MTDCSCESLLMVSGEDGVGGVSDPKSAAGRGQVFAVMESRQLIFWGLAVACFGLSDARVLSLSVPTFWDTEVRKPALMEDVAGGGAHPESDHSRQPAQKPGSPQGYLIQPAEERFPQGPDPHKYPVPPVQQQSVKTDRLALRCRENKVQVEVKQDLMGTGRLAKPEEVTLGGCPPTEVDNWGRVLAFESELHRCGSVLTVRRFSLAARFQATPGTKRAVCVLR